jgi:hypothetical protein
MPWTGRLTLLVEAARILRWVRRPIPEATHPPRVRRWPGHRGTKGRPLADHPSRYRDHDSHVPTARVRFTPNITVRCAGSRPGRPAG